MDSWDPQKMLDKYLYDYLVRKGKHMTAEVFASEADVVYPRNVAIESSEGFLAEWWAGFYHKFCSNQAEHAQESYAEAHNISHVVPAFSPERSEEQFHLRTPEDEVTSNLRFHGMDRPSDMVPFVTDSSRPMEEIPNMPQQLEGKNEGEGHGIYFEQTMQMEPNPESRCPCNVMLPVPEPSKSGCPSEPALG